jgi:hypothetical protein
MEAAAKTRPQRRIRAERQYVQELIERIVDTCPVRRPTSDDEHRAQLLMKEEFAKLGLTAHEEAFWFNDNLYANLALHFGLGTLGSIVSGVAPLAGLALHLTAGSSYLAESTRRGYFLRRLLPFKASQNLVATIPAKGEPDLRLVFLAHADAAFTGLLFNPKVVKNFSGEAPPGLGFIKRGLALATRTQFALAGIDLIRCAIGPLALPLRPLEFLLTLPGFLAFVMNLEMVLRNEIVPGANDDLSGVASLPIMIQRLAPRKPDNVELVFVVTGCEEASLGGADALARAREGVWDKSKTVILGMDGLTNGELRYLAGEGEVIRTPMPHWLRGVCEEVTASEPRFAEVTGFDVPVGGSDVSAFMAHGWEGVCLAAIDPVIGSPLHYHQRTDTPANLDYEKLMFSIDYAEKLALAVMEYKLA